jgi:hypothetical protein
MSRRTTALVLSDVAPALLEGPMPLAGSFLALPGYDFRQEQAPTFVAVLLDGR